MSVDSVEVLFRPFQVRSLQLKNRIVMAPMTRGFAPDGLVGDDNAAYYRRRAERGIGLILSEGTVIDRPSSRNEPNIPIFYGESALQRWKKVIDAVHDAGGRMGPQLWHCGSAKGITGWQPPAPPESPSGLLQPGTPNGVAMSESAIADTVAAFAQAAVEARSLGFDLIELHGAHGYLIDEFFWNGTNERTDRYGGKTMRERSRFAAEVIAAVRSAVGRDFPISLRVSQFKQQDYTARLVETPEAMADWLQPLVDAGVDILHCSQRRFWQAEFPEIDGDNGLNFAGWAKKLTGAAAISVGSVGLSGDLTSTFAGQTSEVQTLDRLLERIAREEFDLIAVGRAVLGDPAWAEKIRAGRINELQGFERTQIAILA